MWTSEFAYFLILAGDKVVVNAVVTEKPCLEQLPDPVEKDTAGLYPACVVTRATGKKKENSDDEITLADTVISQVLEGESIKSFVSDPIEAIAEGSLSEKADKMSTLQLIAEQHKDPELSSLFSRHQRQKSSLHHECFFNSEILHYENNIKEARVFVNLTNEIEIDCYSG